MKIIGVRNAQIHPQFQPTVHLGFDPITYNLSVSLYLPAVAVDETSTGDPGLTLIDSAVVNITDLRNRYDWCDHQTYFVAVHAGAFLPVFALYPETLPNRETAVDYAQRLKRNLLVGINVPFAAASDDELFITVIKDGTVENMRAIVPFLKKWIDRSEAKLGMYDLSRRILLAIAFRHTGQTQKAVEVSEVVNEHGKYPNDQGCIAILCTTRAASLMDIAESGSPSPCEILARARKSLNRANAIRNSEEVMLTYRRMKTLDQRYGCEGGRV